MSIRDELEHVRHVVILGLGKSGASAAEFFAKRGCRISIAEKRGRDAYLQNPSQSEILKRAERTGAAITFEDGIPAGIESADLCISSPGIPLSAKIPSLVRSKGIPLMGELELGLSRVPQPSIIVTGSNGKSTVVSMISHLLEQSGMRPFLCGNIGRPVVDLLGSGAEKEVDYLVVEASSYQLESASRIAPVVGALLNLSENHLERHGSMANYRAAKLKLFSNQSPADFAVLNADDDLVYSAAKDLGSTVCLFGTNEPRLEKAHGAALVVYDPARGRDSLAVRIGNRTNEFDLSKTSLVGAHNRFNWAAALLAASLAGAAADPTQRAIETFRGLPHRLEIVRGVNRAVFINDSKSTTVASSAAALDSVRRAYPEMKIHLLIGGKAKLGSWELLAQRVHASAEVRVSAFGGDGPFVSKALSRFGIDASVYPTMKDAVSAALSSARDDEVVLFSPGCASFDEFPDFEARGDMFRSLVCPT